MKTPSEWMDEWARRASEASGIPVAPRDEVAPEVWAAGEGLIADVQADAMRFALGAVDDEGGPDAE